jgi:hypothetical protein
LKPGIGAIAGYKVEDNRRVWIFQSFRLEQGLSEEDCGLWGWAYEGEDLSFQIMIPPRKETEDLWLELETAVLESASQHPAEPLSEDGETETPSPPVLVRKDTEDPEVAEGIRQFLRFVLLATQDGTLEWLRDGTDSFRADLRGTTLGGDLLSFRPLVKASGLEKNEYGLLHVESLKGSCQALLFPWREANESLFRELEAVVRQKAKELRRKDEYRPLYESITSLN